MKLTFLLLVAVPLSACAFISDAPLQTDFVQNPKTAALLGHQLCDKGSPFDPDTWRAALSGGVWTASKCDHPGPFKCPIIVARLRASDGAKVSCEILLQPKA